MSAHYPRQPSVPTFPRCSVNLLTRLEPDRAPSSPHHGVALDLSGAWRVHASNGDLARRFTDPSISDADWPEVAVPGHWQSTDGVRGQRRADALPPDLRRRRRSSPATGGSSPSTGSSTTATSGSTAATSARPRATSSRTRSRSPTRRARRPTTATCSRSRSRRRPSATARRSGRSPACSRTGTTSTPTGTPAASGVRSACATPARSASSGCARCAPRRPRPAAGCSSTSRSTPARTRTPVPLSARLYATVTGPDGRTMAATTRDVMLAAGDNTLNLTVEVDHPPRWWPWRLGAQPQCDVEVVVEVDGGAERRPAAAHRVPRDPVQELAAVGQRRAHVPDGLEPRPDADGARRGAARRT